MSRTFEYCNSTLWRKSHPTLNVIPAKAGTQVSDHKDPAMNRFEKFFGAKGEAKVTYQDGEFEVTAPGDYVLCAASNEPIALADLRYWNVNRQEAYANAELSLKRHLECK